MVLSPVYGFGDAGNGLSVYENRASYASGRGLTAFSLWNAYFTYLVYALAKTIDFMDVHEGFLI